MPNKELEKAEGQGRRGDSLLGHLSPGDVVIPWNRVTPEVRDYLSKMLDVDRFTAGHEMNLLNPNTGLPEFADGGAEGTGGDNGGGGGGNAAEGGGGNSTEGAGQGFGGFDGGGFAPGFDLSGAVDIGQGIGLGSGVGLGQDIANGLGLGNGFGGGGDYTTLATTVPDLARAPNYFDPSKQGLFDLTGAVDMGNPLGVDFGHSLNNTDLGFGDPSKGLGDYDFRGTALDPVFDRNNTGGFYGGTTEIGGAGGGNASNGSESGTSGGTTNYLPNNPIIPPTYAPYNPPLASPLSPNIPDSLPDQGRYFATLAAGNNTAAANMLAPYLSGNRNIYGR